MLLRLVIYSFMLWTRAGLYLKPHPLWGSRLRFKGYVRS